MSMAYRAQEAVEKTAAYKAFTIMINQGCPALAAGPS